MKIGYSAWGFVGDGVVDSPDGGRLTRALFLEHLIKKGYDIVWLQQNRDVDENNRPLFNVSRINEYNLPQRKTLCNLQYNDGFPDIDILFLEWRWQILGRNYNVDKSSEQYTPDLDRQMDLISYYVPNRNTKIIVWDKDDTMTKDDEFWLLSLRHEPIVGDSDIIIFSPALYPQNRILERETLLFPCNLGKIRGTKVNEDIKYLIGYVGSQYDRDQQVYRYINPFSFKYPASVVFAGNWLKYPDKAVRNIVNFPGIEFKNRILPKDICKIYSQCLTTVLLCRPSYAINCHITQRIHEAVENGVISIGLAEQRGIEQFVSKDNVISDAYDLISRVEFINKLDIGQRQLILDYQISRLEPFDIHSVVQVFEDVLHGKT